MPASGSKADVSCSDEGFLFRPEAEITECHLRAAVSDAVCVTLQISEYPFGMERLKLRTQWRSGEELPK